MEVEIDLGGEAKAVLGLSDRYIRKLKKVLGIKVVVRGEMLLLSGEDDAVERAKTAVEQFLEIASSKHDLDDHEANTIIDAAARDVDSAEKHGIEVFRKGRRIIPRTEGQKKYINAMRENSIVFAIGPAGTGKTYLAVAIAVSSLKRGSVRRIVLARPAVEAGEKLGFLPGDLQEKVNPYLRPLYDAMDDMMDFDEVRQCLSKGVVEIVPMAFMRGRTINDAVVILDEGQNSTGKQMKMFLTRLGENTTAIITGDITQTDLPDSEESGLKQVWSILKGIKDIGFVSLTKKDIVRHRLVSDIVHAYEKAKK